MSSGRVHDVAMAGDPSRVGGAPPQVLVLEVEHVLQRRVNVHHVPAVGVHDPLGPAGGAGRVQDEQQVLGVHALGLAHRAGDGQRHQLVIPVVPPRLHVDLLSRAPHHHAGFDGGLAGHGLVGEVLQAHHLAAQPPAVRGDQHLALGVLDALGQRLHAEPPVHHAVPGADLGAGQHGDDLLGNAGQVDGDDVPLLHPQALQHVGELAHLAVEGGVGVHPRVPRLPFPDQGDLVLAGGLQVAVQGVVDDVGLAAGEPFIEGLFGVVQDPVPGPEPLQLRGPLGPEALRVLHGATVQLFVLPNIGLFQDVLRSVVQLSVALGAARRGGGAGAPAGLQDVRPCLPVVPFVLAHGLPPSTACPAPACPARTNMISNLIRFQAKREQQRMRCRRSELDASAVRLSEAGAAYLAFCGTLYRPDRSYPCPCAMSFILENSSSLISGVRARNQR